MCLPNKTTYSINSNLPNSKAYTGLSTSKTYYLRVTVTDEAGNSTISSTVGRYCWARYTASVYFTATPYLLEEGKSFMISGRMGGNISSNEGSYTEVCFKIYKCVSSASDVTSQTNAFTFKGTNSTFCYNINLSCMTSYIGYYLPISNNTCNSFYQANCSYANYYFVINSFYNSSQYLENDRVVNCTVNVSDWSYILYAKGDIYGATWSGAMKKDTFVDYIYNSSSSTYPSNAYNGSYWYVLQ